MTYDQWKTRDPNEPFADHDEDERPYCERCYNTGELDCHCGGDLCVCARNGTYPCPDCGGA